MELLKKAIESAKTAQSAKLKRLEDNRIEFDKLNNTVKSAMRELGLTQFILETSVGKFTINSNNGIAIPFAKQQFDNKRQDAIVQALVKFFEELAEYYTT